MTGVGGGETILIGEYELDALKTPSLKPGSRPVVYCGKRLVSEARCRRTIGEVVDRRIRVSFDLFIEHIEANWEALFFAPKSSMNLVARLTAFIATFT